MAELLVTRFLGGLVDVQPLPLSSSTAPSVDIYTQTAFVSCKKRVGLTHWLYWGDFSTCNCSYLHKMYNLAASIDIFTQGTCIIMYYIMNNLTANHCNHKKIDTQSCQLMGHLSHCKHKNVDLRHFLHQLEQTNWALGN